MMSFFSGADYVPPMGYAHDPLMSFNPDSPYPSSSTCALQFTLPTCHSDYVDFKRALTVAFRMHGGFGKS